MKKIKWIHSIKIIIPIVILISILIPVLFTNTIFFNLFTNTFENQHKDEIASRAKGMNVSLEQYLESYSKVLSALEDQKSWQTFNDKNSVMTQEEIKTYYSDFSLMNDHKFEKAYQSTMDLITSFELDETIKTIYIGTPKKNMFGNNPGADASLINGVDTDFDCTTRPWYIGAIKNNGSVYWSPPYVDRENEENIKTIISASKAIYTDSGEILGVLAMDIYIDNFSKSAFDFRVDNRYTSFIMDNSGTYVLAESDRIGELVEVPGLVEFLNSNEKYFNYGNQVYTKFINSASGWYIIQSYSSENTKSDMKSILKTVGLFGIAVLFIIILSTYFTSKYYLKPFKILATHFDEVRSKNDLSIKIPENLLSKQNEYGMLSTSIQTMQNNIDIMIKKVEALNHDLIAAQEMYSSLFNSPAIGNALVLDNKIVFVNNTLKDSLGYNDPKEIVGKRLNSIFPKFQPDGKMSNYVLEERLLLSKSSKTSEFDFYYLDKDSNIQITNITMVPTMFKDKPALYIMFREANQERIKHYINSKLLDLYREFDNLGRDDMFVQISMDLQEMLNTSNYYAYKVDNVNKRMTMLYSENNLEELDEGTEHSEISYKDIMNIKYTNKLNIVDIMESGTKISSITLPLEIDGKLEYVLHIDNFKSIINSQVIENVNEYINNTIEMLKKKK
jgi:hypothetical protein